MPILRVTALLLLLACALAHAQSSPFNFTTKPMPQGDNWDQLVPARVGAYQRASLQPPGRGMDGQAQYQGGAQKAFVLFGKADSEKDLAAIFATIESESRAGPGEGTIVDRVSMRPDARYVLRVVKRGGFFAWTRGLYYFSVEHAGGEPGLREFLAAFPY